MWSQRLRASKRKLQFENDVCLKQYGLRIEERFHDPDIRDVGPLGTVRLTAKWPTA
jgi:hypothetical protein